MIIKKIKIKNFGKFKDKSLDFSPGVQVVYGPNEAGKSTLMELIKLMLYSPQEGHFNKQRRQSFKKQILALG